MTRKSDSSRRRSSSLSFIARFDDGETTRMTVHHEPDRKASTSLALRALANMPTHRAPTASRQRSSPGNSSTRPMAASCRTTT